MSRSRKRVPYTQESPVWFRKYQKGQRRCYERSHGVEAHAKQFARQWWQDDWSDWWPEAAWKGLRK